MSVALNPAQREAIRYLDGPCLVIAGAGSGKTRVITHKIIHLIDAGISGRTIAAITFTNKAAQEMAARLATLRKLPADSRPLVSTFHSLGVQMLRRHGTRIGLKKAFSIIDADDAQAILQQALATTDRKAVRVAASRISLWKNALVEPEEAAATAANAHEHSIAQAYREYAATLIAYQAVDFDDLIRLPVRLLQTDAEALSDWRARLRYLLVDEYQDTNACQYELMKLLAGPRAAFTAVGDDDQSIYGWRGATIENLRQLGVDFPALRVIKLEQNYRSTIAILTAANHLIEHNPKLYPKTLWSEHGLGDPIQVLRCDDDEHEAESVVARLQAHRFERRTRYADYAILYRGNHQARIFEQALRKEKVPYVLSGGQSFFDRAEIRDLIAYLRLLVNDEDDPALIRAMTTPKRGIGATSLTALGTYAGERQVSMFAAMFETGLESRLPGRQIETMREFGEFINRIAYRAEREPAAQVIDDWLAAIDYRAHLYDLHEERAAADRWKNVSDFIDWMKKRAEPDEDSPVGKRDADSARGTTLLDLAQSIALLSQIDRKEADQDAVRLTTIHASKGLEFPHVFVVGCEEGLLPHRGDAPAESVEATSDSASDAAAAVTADATGRKKASRSKPPKAAKGPAPAPDSPRAATVDDPVRIEEERRLMYVAVTRAERSLTLSWCAQRKRARDLTEREPSRFLGDMKLEVAPAAVATVSDSDARQRFARLREMLAR